MITAENIGLALLLGGFLTTLHGWLWKASLDRLNAGMGWTFRIAGPVQMVCGIALLLMEVAP